MLVAGAGAIGGCAGCITGVAGAMMIGEVGAACTAGGVPIGGMEPSS
jgi:hypothetical protein